MRYLSSSDLLALSAPDQLIAAIEQALRDFAAGKVLAPERQHLDHGDTTLLVMPVMSETVFGTKVVSVVPSNAARGVPVVAGLMMLNDGTTGQPLAVLNAELLTAQRTGAVGAVAIKYMTPDDVRDVGIIGTGVQAIWQAIFACRVRPIRTVRYFARSEESAQRFISNVQPHVTGAQLVRCESVEQLVTQSQVVVAATTAVEPVIPENRALIEGKHFVSVGSFKPSMQELPALVYELAATVAFDSQAAIHECGDLSRPLAAGSIRAESLRHLADLVTGSARVDTARTTAFKSVGMSLYDLYAAQTFVAEAERLGRGTVLEA